MTRTIDLEEHRPTYLPTEALSQAVAERIHGAYRPQVVVEPPSFKNNFQWALTPQSWVGYIPLDAELGLRIRPKVPLHNIVRMLEYAYGLESLKFFDDLALSGSLEEFFSELANILARRVLDRARRGFYRTYVQREETLSYVRGRLDLEALAARPWDTRLECLFEEHLPDVRENQLLSWTLMLILRTGHCKEAVAPIVRRAYHTVQSFTSVVPFRASDCIGGTYNRLNADYAPMHALCRFFLDHCSPSHEGGAETTLPFLVDMAKLYERFVAEWLRAHLPSRWKLSVQEHVKTGSQGEVSFWIDLIICDARTQEAVWVLDTKYKAPGLPSTDDISQVVTYAQLMKCRQAALVYALPIAQPYRGTFGDVLVQSLTFPLGGDLEAHGQEFLALLHDGSPGTLASIASAPAGRGRPLFP